MLAQAAKQTEELIRIKTPGANRLASLAAYRISVLHRVDAVKNMAPGGLSCGFHQFLPPSW